MFERDKIQIQCIVSKQYYNTVNKSHSKNCHFSVIWCIEFNFPNAWLSTRKKKYV